MPDTTLTCRDCNTSFVFTEGEQSFYAARGYSEPSRCPDCRAARKTERGEGGGGGGYSGGSYSSGGGSYGGGGGGRGNREMFSATCASCGKEAQVPFQPRGDKPVYCSDCFDQRGGSSRGGGGAGGTSGGWGRR
ncbi:MAG: zinc-ribbon domain containing protein [Chloroflexi bacterium]|nr:zinc-ribbon domain containing protein [Chloroflexota bacterium]